MNKLLESCDINYHKYQCDSGLEVFIYTNPLIKEQSAKIVVGAGSNDMINYAPGIAHFLEHTKFAHQHGDYFDDFSKNGADCNAYTNFNETAYYFTCFDHFYENLKILLDMVNTSYFTDDVYAKELEIITQEIKMYDQMPEWQINNLMFNNICYKPYYHDIAGTIADINTITPQMLQAAFEQFYNANNMSISICTNLDSDQVFKFINDNNHLIKKPLVKDYNKENKDIKQNSLVKTNNNLNTTLLSYCYKFDYPSHKQLLNTYICLEIISLVVYSELNETYNECLNNNLINNTLETGLFLTNDLLIYSFDIMGDNYQTYLKTIDQLWDINISQIELGLQKLRGMIIKSLSNKNNFIQKVQEYQLLNINYVSLLELILEIKAEDVYQTFKELKNQYKSSYVVLKNAII